MVIFDFESSMTRCEWGCLASNGFVTVVLLSSEEATNNNSVRPEIRVLYFFEIQPADSKPETLEVVVAFDSFHLDNIDAQFRNCRLSFIY